MNINKISNWQQQGWTLEKLVNKVCDDYDIKRTQLSQKGRQNTISIAKSLICYWGTQELGLSSTEIANYLGISQPAISKASKRGAQYSQQQGLEWGELVNA